MKDEPSDRVVCLGPSDPVIKSWPLICIVPRVRPGPSNLGDMIKSCPFILNEETMSSSSFGNPSAVFEQGRPPRPVFPAARRCSGVAFDTRTTWSPAFSLGRFNSRCIGDRWFADHHGDTRKRRKETGSWIKRSPSELGLVKSSDRERSRSGQIDPEWAGFGQEPIGRMCPEEIALFGVEPDLVVHSTLPPFGFLR
ncbi:hypothetical protein NL676_029033 [Syzygium grande]|nr:hypothetical protein NL676_029033 [Syzygium grande]